MDTAFCIENSAQINCWLVGMPLEYIIVVIGWEEIWDLSYAMIIFFVIA
jgi:hypothetical protein